MGAPKGRPKPKGAGRKAGTQNKATANAREAIAEFVDGNADRLTGWLDQIALDNPKDAFNCLMSVVEYHIPKLARTELTGNEGKDLIPNKVEIEFVNAPKNTDGV